MAANIAPYRKMVVLWGLIGASLVSQFDLASRKSTVHCILWREVHFYGLCTKL